MGVVLLSARVATACDCAQSSFEERLTSSDLVFLASVENHLPLQSITLKVIERFKGRSKDQILVHPGKSDCDYFVPPVSANKGDRFLVFATLRKKEAIVGRCLGSGTEAESVRDLTQLRKVYRK
jgi:hypothetical protein